MNDIFTNLLLDGNGGILQGEHSNQAELPSWTHLNYESRDASKWISSNTSISSHAQDLLLSEDTRPRCVIDDDGSIILSLRGVNLNPSESPEDMISIRVWIKDKMFLTCNRRESQSIKNMYNKLLNQQGPKNPHQLLLGLIEEIAGTTETFILSLENELDSVEDCISEAKFEVFNPKMSRLRRQIATVKRFLTPQKEALDRLYRAKNIGFDDLTYDGLYIQLDRFILILENMDLSRERIVVLQEQFLGYISHQQNGRLYLLAIISAIFLPLTFLTGLLGMNVGGLPGISSLVAFWWVAGFCLISAIILLVWFKRKHWF